MGTWADDKIDVTRSLEAMHTETTEFTPTVAFLLPVLLLLNLV